MTNHTENPTPMPAPRADTPSWWRRSWVAFGACLVPAAVLAACSLGGDDDAATSDAVDLTADAEIAATSTPAADTTTSDTATSDTATSDTATDATTTATPTTEPDTTSVATDVHGISFAADIEPIITTSCANCHTGNGPGTQHVIMDTAGVVAKASVGIEFVTRTGFMPPWPASDESVAFEHDWSLTDDQIALLADWHEAGAPLDVAEDHVIAPASGQTVRLTDPDVAVLSQGAYDGKLGQDDEYRCLIYDPEFDGPGFVTGMDFQPQQEQVVHHAVGFLLSADDRAALEAIDATDGNGGGWTCFGFSPAPSADLIYAWAPGQAASRYPEGSGLHLDDGDFFVIQTHYHFDVEAPADQSTLALDWTPEDEGADLDRVDITVYTGPAEVPCSSDEAGPLCDRDAAIALAREKYGPGGVLADGILALCGQTPADYAGFTDGYSESSCDLRAGASGELVSVFGHEHEVGASFRMTLNPGTPEELVVLDIPDWDFDWQLNYEPTDTIVIERDDVVRLECSWDRARRDPTLEPAYIVWSDGTDDEMCFASIVTRPI
ncbi:hypothetical protein [Ilumatobacter coccineus]|nr:hypothetical protein [Ilumatobacter coccineus]